MKETFKIRCEHRGYIFYDTVEGEEVFEKNGYRFFIRRDWDESWVVSDVRYGAKIAESPFYGDAINKAKQIVEKHFSKYVEKLKIPPRPLWRYSRKSA